MGIRIRFDRSEACAASHSTPERELTEGSHTVDYDDSDGPWVQFTYSSLRSQDGAFLISCGSDNPDDAHNGDCGDACEVHHHSCDCWWVDVNGTDEPYSDVVIEFVGVP